MRPGPNDQPITESFDSIGYFSRVMSPDRVAKHWNDGKISGQMAHWILSISKWMDVINYKVLSMQLQNMGHSMYNCHWAKCENPELNANK